VAFSWIMRLFKYIFSGIEAYLNGCKAFSAKSLWPLLNQLPRSLFGPSPPLILSSSPNSLLPLVQMAFLFHCTGCRSLMRLSITQNVFITSHFHFLSKFFFYLQHANLKIKPKNNIKIENDTLFFLKCEFQT
jgi:hypothetical protein